MQCERCGACCQDFAVLITFDDIIRILHAYPEYSLRSIAQLYIPQSNKSYAEFLAKYPQIHLFEDDQDRVGYLILNWNPEKWNLHAHKIMCTFYDFKGEKCRIHGVHPRTCQAYPFMKESSIIDRPNRRCPKLFIPDERDPEGISKILRFLEDELQVYREQCDKWNQRPNKQRKWKDLALYLRKTYV